MKAEIVAELRSEGFGQHVAAGAALQPQI